MRQLSQKLKDGSMQIIDVPDPGLGAGSVLVRNHFSLISAGTESSTVRTARMSYLGKAKERPQQVKQVIDTLRSQGVVQTYRAVMKKLDAYSPLGYSSAGSVIKVSPDVTGFAVGDLAACGGLTASHAEVISVPVNLCVKLRPDADLKAGAYNTLGAIALQGVRQAELCLGETCAVIGMGLLGQLTGLLLRASGVRVVGIDIDPATLETALNRSADVVLTRNGNGVEDTVLEFTNGLGCDAVIITAASLSLDPINFAGAIARKRGVIVVVGAVPTGFDREPHFYKKELQVRMSCSYGPGRYDPVYEEKGIDYPPAYVRWTEKRNMEAFQHLIQSGKIDVSPLTTHVFKIQDAPAAYDMILQKQGRYLGILIEYDYSGQPDERSAKVNLKPRSGTKTPSLSIGFIGAGSYAQSHLLPNIPKDSRISLKGVVTATGTSARSVGDRFGFDFCSSSTADILENPDINTLFIATRHDSHAQFVVNGLKAGKHIFVEKPLCITEEELDEIVRTYTSSDNPLLLMVGYNRRFAPLSQALKEEIGSPPMAMSYRVNAGAVPKDSWIQDMATGGGRVVGEVCHFVDLLTFFSGSLPTTVYAAVMKSVGDLNDTLAITLTYSNGSIGSICYFANGDKALPKERVEIYAHGATGILDDFRRLTVFANGKKKERKGISQDKGQKQEVALFIEAILKGQGEMISFGELHNTSRVTFAVLESIRTGQSISL